LADRSNRVTIVGFAIITWSVFTAACGAATSFIQLLLCRVGVGVGEAGGAPPSQSLIADSFPPDRRSGALAVFALGAPIGASIGLIGGGLLAGLIGWRWTMVAAGAPGILIGALVLLTLRDPRIIRRDGSGASEPSLRAALGQLITQRAFVLMALGGALLSFVNYGSMAFAGSFYLRNHLSELTDLGALVGLPPLGVIGIGLGLLGASGGALGALVGGKLGDRFGTRDVRALTIIPAVGSVFCAAGYLVMFTLPGALWSLAMFAFASFFSNLWYGPGTLGLQRLAGPKAKATALAVALFVNSVIGLSLGPLLIGIISDAFAPALGEGEALRAGILIGLSAGILSGLLYWLAARSIAADIGRAEADAG
jgi:MFS family permease